MSHPIGKVEYPACWSAPADARTGNGRGSVLDQVSIERHRLLAEITPGIMNALEAIDATARRASHLTEALARLTHAQDMARSSRGHLDANAQLLTLRGVLTRILPRGVTLRLHLKASRLRPVRGIATEFDSAILNLVVNARDALPPRAQGSAAQRGMIAIRTRDFNLIGPDGRTADYIQVTVATDRAAMDAATLATSGGRPCASAGVDATGCALDRVYRFAEAAGGQVRTRGGRGRGTAVHLLLPCLTAAGDRPDGAAEGSRMSPAPNVLPVSFEKTHGSSRTPPTREFR